MKYLGAVALFVLIATINRPIESSSIGPRVLDVPLEDTLVYNVHYKNEYRDTVDTLVTFTLPNGVFCQKRYNTNSDYQCVSGVPHVK